MQNDDTPIPGKIIGWDDQDNYADFPMWKVWKVGYVRRKVDDTGRDSGIERVERIKDGVG